MAADGLGCAVAVRHEVAYRFDPPATLGVHRIRLVPMVGERTVGRSTLDVTPRPAAQHSRVTSDGITVAEVRHPRRTAELHLVARAAVDIGDGGLLTEPGSRAGVTPPTSGNDAAVDAGLRCCTQVAEEIRYVERHDPTPRSAAEVVERGEGSCRDMAWLAHERLAAEGWRSRVVTGWMLPHRPADPAGAWVGALHAWVDLASADGDWVGIDPTTGRPTGSRHVRLCCGTRRRDVEVVTGRTSPAAVTVTSTISLGPAEDHGRHTGPPPRTERATGRQPQAASSATPDPLEGLR